MAKRRTPFEQIREQTADIRDTDGDAPLKVEAAGDPGPVAPGSPPSHSVDEYPPKADPHNKEEE